MQDVLRNGADPVSYPPNATFWDTPADATESTQEYTALGGINSIEMASGSPRSGAAHNTTTAQTNAQTASGSVDASLAPATGLRSNPASVETNTVSNTGQAEAAQQLLAGHASSSDAPVAHTGNSPHSVALTDPCVGPKRCVLESFTPIIVQIWELTHN